MQKMTITEALAELRLIDKRIGTKQENVFKYLMREESRRDPLEKQGGSVSFVKREVQAIGDLCVRKVLIRLAIQRVNTLTNVTVGSVTRSIAGWLVWRRDVAPLRQHFLTKLAQTIDITRKDAMRRGHVVTQGPDEGPGDFLVNYDEIVLAEDIEELDVVLETLDGQLSLKNATTFVEF